MEEKEGEVHVDVCRVGDVASARGCGKGELYQQIEREKERDKGKDYVLQHKCNTRW
jgi:hypothetical protein